jgi:hypothetical protein
VAWIFLCHASEDKAQVREVYHCLRAIDGFEPWLDEVDLLPGQDWNREIQQAIQNSDFILIFLSRTSVTRRSYVQREMKLALDAWQSLRVCRCAQRQIRQTHAVPSREPAGASPRPARGRPGRAPGAAHQPAPRETRRKRLGIPLFLGQVQ